MAAKDFGPIESDYAFFGACHGRKATLKNIQADGYADERTKIRCSTLAAAVAIHRRFLSRMNGRQALELTLVVRWVRSWPSGAETGARFSDRPILAEKSPAGALAVDLVLSNHVLY